MTGILKKGTHVTIRMASERRNVHEGLVVTATETAVAVQYGKRVVIVPWTAIEQINILDDVNGEASTNGK